MSEEKTKKSLILGLTGSLGSGKSFVSSLLSQCQAKVVCADDLAREAVSPKNQILGEIAEEFGPEVLNADGTLNRSSLGSIVFADPSKRKRLEELIHPYVRKRARSLFQDFSGHPLIVYDVPLLFESHADQECDRTAVVVIEEDVRRRRLIEDRGMTDKEIQRRLAAQMPQREKAARADFVIDNSHSRAHTAQQVTQILLSLFPGGLPKPLKVLPAGLFQN